MKEELETVHLPQVERLAVHPFAYYKAFFFENKFPEERGNPAV